MSAVAILGALALLVIWPVLAALVWWYCTAPRASGIRE